MNRFNAYMNSHFSGCRLLARARDTARERDVTLHQIPGFWDIVGVSDGVESWIAPSAAAPFFKTATGDVADIMRRLQAGEEVGPVPQMAVKRARIALEDDEPQPRPSKRVQIEEAQQTPRRARHAFV